VTRQQRAALVRELMDPRRREHFVYRAFESFGQLLYVGCTRSVDQRRYEHSRWSEWYQFAARCHISGPYTYTVARRIESTAISTESPYFNVTLTWQRERRARRATVAKHQVEIRTAHPEWDDIRVLEAAVLEATARNPVSGPMREYLTAVSA
jgi:hypothetical protein